MEIPEFYRMKKLLYINIACLLLMFLISYICKIGIIDIKSNTGFMFVSLVIGMIVISELIQLIFIVQTFDVDRIWRNTSLAIIAMKIPIIILLINDYKANELWLPIYFLISWSYSILLPFATMDIYRKRLLDMSKP